MNISLVQARKLEQEIANLLTDKNKFGLCVDINVHNVDVRSIEFTPQIWNGYYTDFESQNAKHVALTVLRFKIRDSIATMNHSCNINKILNEVALSKLLLARNVSMTNVVEDTAKMTNVAYASRALESLRDQDTTVSRFREDSVTLFPINDDTYNKAIKNISELKRTIRSKESALTELNHVQKIEIDDVDVKLLEAVNLL